jgi:hypothetical protein
MIGPAIFPDFKAIRASLLRVLIFPVYIDGPESVRE